jgi:hypothetical protein
MPEPIGMRVTPEEARTLTAWSEQAQAAARQQPAQLRLAAVLRQVVQQAANYGRVSQPPAGPGMGSQQRPGGFVWPMVGVRRRF